MRRQPDLEADEAYRNVGLGWPPDDAGKQRRFQYSDTQHAQREFNPHERWVTSSRLALSDRNGCSVLTQNYQVVIAIPDNAGHFPESTSDAVWWQSVRKIGAVSMSAGLSGYNS